MEVLSSDEAEEQRRFGPTDDTFQDSQLCDLLNIAEGWLVEYKQKLPDAGIIAKSVASFANSRGGWVFYGVEGSKSHERAQSFPGLDAAELGLYRARINDGVRTNISPVPYFEVTVINGPLQVTQEHQLPEGRVVVAVRVPLGLSTPYFHQSGKIYVREGSSSEPKAANDRATFLYMEERRRQVTSLRERLLKLVPHPSKGEGEEPILHVLLTTDPTGQRPPIRLADLRAFRQALSGGNMKWDNFFSLSNRLVARQINDGDPRRLSPTVQWIGGDLVATTNLNRLGWSTGSGYRHWMRVRDHYGGVGVLDMQFVLAVVFGTITTYLAALKGAGVPLCDVFACARVENIWRMAPYLDVEEFASQVGGGGLPVQQCSEANTLGDPDTGFLSLGPADRGPVFLSKLLFGIIGLALGIEAEAVNSNELQDALDRCPTVNPGQRPSWPRSEQDLEET